MNNLFKLLKVNFINNFGLNAFFIKDDKKEKRKALSKLGIVLLVPIVFLYISSVYSILLADMLKSIGAIELLLLLGVIGSALTVLFTSVYKAQGTLFSAKDFDMLMALPISNEVIFTSKLIDLLSLNWIFTACVMIPPSVVYFINRGENPVTFFFMIVISIFLLPLLPIIIGAIGAFIISYFASKFKYKNLISILGSTCIFLAIFLASFKIQDLFKSLTENSSNIIDILGVCYPPSIYLTKGLINGDLLEFLKFVGISVIPFIIFVFLFSKQFKKINSRLGENFKKEEDFKISKLKSNSQLKALYLKELKGYFSTPIYVLNTAFGMILLIIGAVAIFFVDKNTIATFVGVPGMSSRIGLLILGLMIFCIGLSSTTPSSISIEGKNLWIAKSLPIGENSIFLSKILLCLTITVPAVILANILFAIGLKFSVIDILWNLVISVLYCFLSATMGIIINLYFPKLEWSSPTTVVKQSASVFINMIFTFISIGIPVAMFIMVPELGISVFLGINLVLIILVIAGELMLLKTKGKELFYKL
ncbi:ABC transporter permease [Clostridium perfringens]|nr:ABC transporter permease [Clostridium perfringens]